jgi:hypothetical protein
LSEAEIIAEAEVVIKELAGSDCSYTVSIGFGNQFTAEFLFDLIRNEPLRSSEMTLIRVLETSGPTEQVYIGNERSINLAGCLRVVPLLGRRFYDYEWGHLNVNLGRLEGENEAYDHLGKITRSSPGQYPQFTNQEILDVQECDQLVFRVEGRLLRVPLVYVLQGLNVVGNSTLTLKFFIDSVRTLPAKAPLDEKSGCRALYELAIGELVNLSRVSSLLDKHGVDSFHIKIINEDTFYFLPFARTFRPKAQFKQEAKLLATQQQVSLREGDRICWLLPHPKAQE